MTLATTLETGSGIVETAPIRNPELEGKGSDHTLDLYSSVRERAPVRNPKFRHGTPEQYEDIVELRKKGVPKSKRMHMAKLLHFLRIQFFQGKKYWEGTQDWFAENIFFGERSRQFVGELLRVLTKLGVIIMEKQFGFTREMRVGFVGWEWEAEDHRWWDNSPVALHKHSDVNESTSECRDSTKQLYIQNSLHTPSQKREWKGVSENTQKNSKEGELSTVHGIAITEQSKKGKSGLTRVGKGDKSSGALASIKTPISSLQNRFTPEQWEKFNDEEFLRSIVSDWVREGRSQICRLDLMADKVRLVQSYLAKNPWDIEILWPSYFKGRITRTAENVLNGALPAEDLEKYVPSLALELQLQEPEVSHPILKAMQELSGQNVLLAASSEGGEAETTPQAPVEINAELESGGDEEWSNPELVQVMVVEHELGLPERSLDWDSIIAEVQRPGANPSIEYLRQIYEASEYGRSYVARQIAANPQWNYVIVDGAITDYIPPIETLQRRYDVPHEQAKKAVARQIAANPQWGYAIVNGQVKVDRSTEEIIVEQSGKPVAVGSEEATATGLIEVIVVENEEEPKSGSVNAISERLPSDGELTFMPEIEMRSSDNYLEWNHPGGEPEPNWYSLTEGDNGELVEDRNWEEAISQKVQQQEQAYYNSCDSLTSRPIGSPEASSSQESEPIASSTREDPEVGVSQSDPDISAASVDSGSAPPLATLQKLYKSPVTRSIVSRHLVNNSEWGYEILDGNVVSRSLTDCAIAEAPELDISEVSQATPAQHERLMQLDRDLQARRSPN